MQEMEDELTIEELQLLVKAAREQEHRMMKFMAALKGVDLDAEPEGEESAFDRVKIRAEADKAGITEEEYVFDMIGIEVVTEEEVN